MVHGARSAKYGLMDLVKTFGFFLSKKSLFCLKTKVGKIVGFQNLFKKKSHRNKNDKTLIP